MAFLWSVSILLWSLLERLLEGPGTPPETRREGRKRKRVVACLLFGAPITVHVAAIGPSLALRGIRALLACTCGLSS